MDWITEDIAIGNYLDAVDLALHKEAGIHSLLCLDGELRPADAAEMGLREIVSFAFIDGEGNSPASFEAAVKAVGRLSTTKPKLLVQCHAGRSRSVVIVAAYLMLTRRWPSEKALAYIAERREIALTPGIEKLLRSAWLV
jgi:protein-tyrosine phosphatase